MPQLQYQVEVLKFGLMTTIKLIRQVVPASIVCNGSYLTVSVEAVDAQLLADKLNEAGIHWWLPERK